MLFQPDMCDSVSLFMANTHRSVNEMSHAYLQNERRYNYTTPKSFLEQIKLYQNLLMAQHADLQAKTVRLENGLEKLKSTATQVQRRHTIHSKTMAFVLLVELASVGENLCENFCSFNHVNHVPTT